MCTRFVYRGDNIITGFNFDIDIVEWNHKVINTKMRFIMFRIIIFHRLESMSFRIYRSMKNYRIKDNLSVYKWLLDSLFKKRCKN